MAVYLVSGAAGFIGANYVNFVLDREPDARVVAVDYLGSASNVANLDSVADRVTFERADIAEMDAMKAVYRTHKPDYVVNFAAESHNDRAIMSPSSFMRSNALGAQVMLECSRLNPVSCHVHVSTIEVYGELAAGAPYFNEGSPLNAKTPYSAAKAAGDQIVRAYMHTYPAMRVRMTHCANNYGPYQLPEKLLPLAITNVMRGRKVPIYGDGRQTRDWLHVMDHCRAVHAVLHAELGPIPKSAATDPAQLPIFDFSARQEVNNIDVVRRALKALDVEPDDWIQNVEDRPNHDRRYMIDPRKAEAELGWRPTVEFEAGIAETVAWYSANREWWHRIFETKGELQFDWSQYAGGPTQPG